MGSGIFKVSSMVPHHRACSDFPEGTLLRKALHFPCSCIVAPTVDFKGQHFSCGGYLIQNVIFHCFHTAKTPSFAAGGANLRHCFAQAHVARTWSCKRSNLANLLCSFLPLLLCLWVGDVTFTIQLPSRLVLSCGRC